MTLSIETEFSGVAKVAVSKCGFLRFRGITYDGAMMALLADRETSDWMRDVGLANGHSEFRRVWDWSDTARVGIGMTEDSVALAFAELHHGELRYDHDAGAWHQWTGTHWCRERTKLAYAWARGACRSAAKKGGIENARGAAALARAAAAAGVERLAQSDRTFAVTGDLWDRDLMLLGTPGGTVDLTTGELRPASREDYITKQTAVAPAAVPDCPIWDQFLHDATAGDFEMIRFLKQWAGYCLTGMTHEHALLFIWGPGGNGKSVFINTLATVMGAYAVTSSMDTLSASASPRHSTDLAALRGARLVTANETEEGRPWSETRGKQLTGGDRIAARFMYRDFFEYLPQFKLNVIGNAKPVLRIVDTAIRRRLNLAPFEHTPANPDMELEQKLRAEAPQILRWAIEGCLDWQQHGLVRPPVVLSATAAYFESQDHFGRWLEECCDLGATVSARPSHLLHSFQRWCAANGEPATDNRQLRGMIERTRGLRYTTIQGAQWVRGLALKPVVNQDMGAP